MYVAQNTGRKRTTLVVGIDEAGYGPLLGPLVVSAAAFEMPMESEPTGSPAPDLWHVLRTSVARRLRRRDPRLCVADSKTLFKRSDDRGLALLERGVLTFLAQAGDPPPTLEALVRRVCPDGAEIMKEYPWYTEADLPLPTSATADEIRTQRNALQADLAAHGLRVVGIFSEILPAGHFNRRVEATRNKAVVLFGLTLRLIQRAVRAAGAEDVCVCVDRQGGRTHYRRPLMTAFPDARLEIVEESPERCSYRLNRPGGAWLVHFLKNGEARQLPIALASMASKYLRELMMSCFNRYWCTHVADLRPTAGYYEDGRRFLTEIAEAMTRLKIEPRHVARVL